jgi:GMP synthase-like glutamine amidotransferase
MSLVVLITFDKNGSKSKFVKRFKEYDIFFQHVDIDDLENFLERKRKDVKVYILSGSTRRILRYGIYPSIDRILRMPTPVIGICYGFQYMAMRSGGTLMDGGENSLSNANFVKTVEYGGKNRELKMWTSHYDKVLTLPKKVVDENAPIKAIWDIDFMMDDSIYMAHTDKWVGFQFHPEYKKNSFDEFILPFVCG